MPLAYGASSNSVAKRALKRFSIVYNKTLTLMHDTLIYSHSLVVEPTGNLHALGAVKGEKP